MEAELVPTDPGEYLVVSCANPSCGKPMLITGTWQLQIGEAGPPPTIRPEAQPMTCPHCQTESVYLPAAIWHLQVEDTPEA
jgi:hypothetical protein